ncbi:hypothetical protein ERJ70_08865 [Sediminibacillus dalangtanensis]|uniref:Hydrolase n=1 Tax=Sediminibacillus dalangtanensis TaxID=2729421 RepID=A0ABX7VVC7_9BACI|nr:hypothetical protein [Sediminibacillus dalangtanensis]QTM99403.1 hypothetical protein ERJ70_08865 [Sediminibacillus dalangtanensis]
MSENKKYYVKVDTGEVLSSPTYDNSVEYEIEGDYEDKLSLENLFHEQHLAGSRSAELHYEAPFQEVKADQERKKYDDEMLNIYQRIYELGTPETKEKIEEIGILEEKRQPMPSQKNGPEDLS